MLLSDNYRIASGILCIIISIFNLMSLNFMCVKWNLYDHNCRVQNSILYIIWLPNVRVIIIFIYTKYQSSAESNKVIFMMLRDNLPAYSCPDWRTDSSRNIPDNDACSSEIKYTLFLLVSCSYLPGAIKYK